MRQRTPRCSPTSSMSCTAHPLRPPSSPHCRRPRDSATVLSAFPAMAPRRHGAPTVLTGLLDQSALYGVLAEIEALGLDLLEIRKLAPQRRSPESGDSRSP